MLTRLLVASYLLEDPTQRVRVVAQKVGFVSEVAFRRAVRRCLGIRPSDLRFRGALIVLARLRPQAAPRGSCVASRGSGSEVA
jgi:AraC-like DNA-binding protein